MPKSQNFQNPSRNTNKKHTSLCIPFSFPSFCGGSSILCGAALCMKASNLWKVHAQQRRGVAPGGAQVKIPGLGNWSLVVDRENSGGPLGWYHNRKNSQPHKTPYIVGISWVYPLLEGIFPMIILGIRIMSHTIHGTDILWPTWRVDFYGKCR